MSASPHMTLRFLGAGGAFSRSYGTTCSMITLRSGELWLIDCGRQAPDQLHAAGIGWHEITGQVITHVHGDHVYGLEDFAFRRYYEASEDMPSIRGGGPRPKLMAHSAVEDELWQMLESVLRYIPDPDRLTGGTMDDYFERIAAHANTPPKHNAWNHAESFTTDGLSMTARECVHVPGKPSTSLELAVNDEQIAWWSGDSTVDHEWLTKNEPRTTVFFHDCTFTDYPGQVHGSFALLKALPEAVRLKTVLMHHEDDIETNRTEAEALGFRLGLPGQAYDLETGKLAE
jgi:ribonuclease BN (tRNA processing enzyme)